MPKKITYFAMVDDLSSKDEPAGVLRRIEDDQGQRDEAFTRNLKLRFVVAIEGVARLAAKFVTVMTGCRNLLGWKRAAAPPPRASGRLDRHMPHST